MRKIFSFILVFMCCLTLAAQSPNTKSSSKVVVGGTYYYVHTVKPGETLYSLSKAYNVSQDEITKNNPASIEGLKTDQVIKIPVEKSDDNNDQTFLEKIKITSKKNTEHIANQGETAYSIAKRYAISIDNLIASNPGFDPASLRVGQKIIIPRKLVGSATQSEVKETFLQYNQALADLSPEFKFHLVEKGETLYSLSKQFNVAIDSIEKYNKEVLAGGLKLGSTLKIPITSDVATIETDEPRTEPKIRVRFGKGDGVSKKVNTDQPLNVVIMLPFVTTTGEEKNFVDFYNGALIALQDLKREGVSVNLSVANCKRSESQVENIINNKDLESADLIIGPVYNEQFGIVADFAKRNRIPIVSPLAAVNADNPFVYQVAPDQRYRTNKLRDVIGVNKNTIIITTDTGGDNDFKNEMTALIPATSHHIKYYKGMSSSIIETAMKNDRENVIVIATENENITEEILARISSIQNAASSKSLSPYMIDIVGSPRWARFSNINKELFFKLNVSYITSYHADRSNENVLKFGNTYMTTFGSVPTLYSYRGYDVAKLFVGSIKNHGERFFDYLDTPSYPLLQVPYKFVRDDNSEGKVINNQWVLVKYNPNFTISVK